MAQKEFWPDAATGFWVDIPGTPIAQARNRTRVIQRNGKPIAINYDPKKSRDWKATAQQHMLVARQRAGLGVMAGPLMVEIEATFECPRSQWRKGAPRPGTWWPKKPDIDNITKAVFDAGNGVLWLDDREIVALHFVKLQAPQGSPAKLRILVKALGG